MIRTIAAAAVFALLAVTTPATAAADFSDDDDKQIIAKINSEYPGLAVRSLGLTNLSVSQFIVCMEHDKDAADWEITRDRGGVHISGLLYQQNVALNFVDHGDRLEIIGASYGDRISLTQSDATSVLFEITVGRCN